MFQIGKDNRKLGKARHILDKNSLHYYALVEPYLSYCAEVWGNTYNSPLKKICTLQKRAVRLINLHTNSLFLNSYLLKFPDLVKFKMAQTTFKAWNNSLPGNIQKLFKERNGTYDFQNKITFKQTIVHTTLRKMCISVYGITFNSS